MDKKRPDETLKQLYFESFGRIEDIPRHQLCFEVDEHYLRVLEIQHKLLCGGKLSESETRYYMGIKLEVVSGQNEPVLKVKYVEQIRMRK